MPSTVRDWMSSPVVVVDPDSSVKYALPLMRRRKIHSVVVSMSEKNPQYGIVTSTDIRDKIVAAGRNPGERVGRGEPPELVAADMTRTGELTEGYPSLDTGWRLLEQLVHAGLLAEEDFPLLAALHRVVYRGAGVAVTLAALKIRDASLP